MIKLMGAYNNGIKTNDFILTLKLLNESDNTENTSHVFFQHTLHILKQLCHIFLHYSFFKL